MGWKISVLIHNARLIETDTTVGQGVGVSWRCLKGSSTVSDPTFGARPMPQSERRNPERHHRATSVLEQTGRVQHFHTLQAYQRSVQKGTLFMDVHIYIHIYIYPRIFTSQKSTNNQSDKTNIAVIIALIVTVNYHRYYSKAKSTQVHAGMMKPRSQVSTRCTVDRG